METKLNLTSEMGVSVIRPRTIITLPELKGDFLFELLRKGKKIAEIPFPNGATNVGKQYVLGSAFAGVTPITTWYIGLIDGTDGVPTIAADDTMASHDWDEFGYYDEASRQTWTKAINTLTNQMAASAPAQFTVSSGVPVSGKVAGAFLVSVSTKAGSTGTLYAHGLFPSSVPVENDDIVRINYVTGL